MATMPTSSQPDNSCESLFKFFIKVFSLDIDVGEHEATVFIEIHVDGQCVERTVDHSTRETTWDDLLMISVLLLRDGKGFEGRIIELHLYRKVLRLGEEFLVATYEIDTALLTSEEALSKKKSSTILLSPLDVQDDEVDLVIGQPDVLVTVGCAFVRDVTTSEDSEDLHPCIPDKSAGAQNDRSHVDQYRALTMLYHEAGKGVADDEDEDDENMKGLLGEVDELIRGGEASVWNQRHSPKVEAMRCCSIDTNDDLMSVFVEEERILKQLNLGLQQVHALPKFDQHHKALSKIECDALRSLFSCVMKVDRKAKAILNGVHVEVMNVAILGEVVGVSFCLHGSSVSSVSWHVTEYEDSDVDSEDSEVYDDTLVHNGVEDEVVEDVLSNDIANTLFPLKLLKELSINNPCLTGDISPLLGLSLQSLSICDCSVWGVVDHSTLASSVSKLQVLKLRSTNVHSNTLLPFGECHHLRVLDLGYSKVGGSLTDLTSCVYLEQLLVDGTSIEGDVSTIAHFPFLKKFSASHTQLTLAKSSVEKLAHNGPDKAAGYESSSNLLYFDVSYSLLEANIELFLAVISFMNSDNLQHLDVTHTMLKGNISALVQCPGLTEVGLAYNPQLMGSLHAWLPRACIEYLDIRGTLITDSEDYIEKVQLLRSELRHPEEPIQATLTQKTPPPLPPPPQRIRKI